jgi:tetratricopeptide (TPR) repeat protein
VNRRLLGNFGKATPLFTEATGINQKAGNFYAALLSFELLAELELIRGQLHQALDLYLSGLKLAQNWKYTEGKQQGSLIVAAGPQLGLGRVLYQLNDLERSAAYIRHSADLFGLGDIWGKKDAYAMLAYLRQAQGEFVASTELLRKVIAIKDTILVRRSSTTDLPSLTELANLLGRARPEMAHLLMDVSQRVEKLGVHANTEVDFCSPTDYPREFDYSDLARLLIVLDRAAEALPLLTRLLEAAITMERHGDEIRYLVMMALAHCALGNTKTALDTLSRTLTLAEPEGYVRLFVDEGQPMAELLLFAISQRRRKMNNLSIIKKSITMLLTQMILLSLVAPAMAQEDRVAPGQNIPITPFHPQGLTDPDELGAFLDDLLAQEMEEYHIAGAAVSVVEDGKLFFAKGYGYADLEKGIPVDPEQTVFRIGSVGKTFTWTAVMQLVEQGKLDLDADVDTYLDFRIPDTYPQPITLKNLMTHTSGFDERWAGSMVSDVKDVVPVREWLVSHLAARALPPGDYAGYSNYNAMLAGYIVARVSGQPYDQYIQEHILDPLDMAHSTAQSAMPADLRAQASIGYRYVVSMLMQN